MGKSSKRTLDQATASDAAAPAAMEVDSAAAPAVASPTKKSKKDKKDKSGAAGASEGDDKEVGLEQLAEIAKPLAVKKTGKHVLRLVKKGEFLTSCLNTSPVPSGLSSLVLQGLCMPGPARRPGRGCHVLPVSDAPTDILHRLAPKSASKSRHLKRGVKEVVKSIRKGEKGCVARIGERTVLHAELTVLAVSQNRCFGCRHLASRHPHPHSSACGGGKLPLHRMSTLSRSLRLRSRTLTPSTRTQWVTSKESLGLASSTKRPTSCVMVAEKGMKRKAAKDGEAAKDDSKAKETEKEFQEEYAGVKKEVESMVRRRSVSFRFAFFFPGP